VYFHGTAFLLANPCLSLSGESPFPPSRNRGYISNLDVIVSGG